MKIKLAQFHHIVLQNWTELLKKPEPARGRQMSGIPFWMSTVAFKALRKL